MRPRCSGFTLLAVLAAMTLLALSVQGVMWIVSTQAQRDRELELLRVGAEYRAAIGRYVEASPGRVRAWPPDLKSLLDDRRLVSLRRHLRRLYADPVGRTSEWGIVRAPDGGVAGVYSLSQARPIRTAGLDLFLYGVKPAESYQGWRFVYVPRAAEGGMP